MRRLAITLVVLTTLIGSVSTAAVAHPAEAGTHVGLARFEGRWLDLSGSWGGARACVVPARGATRCFRTAAQMARYTASIPLLSCATPLILYDFTSLQGTTASIYPRG